MTRFRQKNRPFKAFKAVGMSRHGGLDEYRPKMICFYFNSDHTTQEIGTRLRKAAVKEAISVPTESVDLLFLSS